MLAKKIQSVEYVRSWNGPEGKVYFYKVQLEGEPQPYEIGTKTLDPDFLEPGAVLHYEFKPGSKTSIRRVAPPEQPATRGKSELGWSIGNAINAAINLVVHDKVPLSDLGKYVEEILNISLTLQKKYDGQ